MFNWIGLIFGVVSTGAGQRNDFLGTPDAGVAG